MATGVGVGAGAGRKHESQFKVDNRVITEAAISPLTGDPSAGDWHNVADESDFDGGEASFSPFAADMGSSDDRDIEREAAIDEDDEVLDFEWFGPSNPKRFMVKSTSEGHENADRKTRHASMSFSCDLNVIIRPESDDDVVLPINEDFWKDVDTTVPETELEMPLDFATSISPSGGAPNKRSDVKESKEPSATIDDFIRTDTSYSSRNNSYSIGNSSSAKVPSQFMYPIKKLSFRDAYGKLALDPQVSSVQVSSSFSNSALNHTYNRVAKSGKRKSKFKKLSRSKSGWCEMVSTGIGIGEFMLL
ncbi:unnamed protein product [Kluyveromyces dobzhanskii CBS 2104]|uniref:WGS project CCBQ000000000 data, contig 00097 n=1 Tax=Kluyveromyces dobzhanskii CBS 2104 TaxID=1427455 RepID=A0A0A8L4V5_9SACH|nr:unnamed protein product [Kluyveromyces dobzhanskii CBS 2104]